MKYFVIKSGDSNIALVFHDYLKGTYIRRAVKESFCQVFDACVESTSVKLVREASTLRLMSYSSFDYGWIDDVLAKILSCNPDWVLAEASESSGSDLTIDDLAKKYLTISS